jgi:hypothetical protein
MAKRIELKSYNFPKARPNFNAGNLLKKIRQDTATKKNNKVDGLISTGIVEVTHISGGYSWALSGYVDFSWIYIDRPILTGWGIDGTAGIDWAAGDNKYSSEIPGSLLSHTLETYQPAMFMPRIIHWNIVQGNFLGCHFLVMQLNPNCTEVDKTVRLHYTFTGRGHKKG